MAHLNLPEQFLIDASYLLAAFLFIYGLKRMSSPVTARSGVVWAGGGMALSTPRCARSQAASRRRAARASSSANIPGTVKKPAASPAV